jgi:hypothetical protein
LKQKTSKRMAPYQTARILSIEVTLEAVSLLSEFTLEVLPNKKGGRAIKMTPSKLTTKRISVRRTLRRDGGTNWPQMLHASNKAPLRRCIRLLLLRAAKENSTLSHLLMKGTVGNSTSRTSQRNLREVQQLRYNDYIYSPGQNSPTQASVHQQQPHAFGTEERIWNLHCHPVKTHMRKDIAVN